MSEELSNTRDPFLHLKESIGSLMFLWCRLDDALSDALQNGVGLTRRQVDGSFHERLTKLKGSTAGERGFDPTRKAEIMELCNRLDEARRQRNLIVHSLSGVCADPARGEPSLLCQDNEGGRQNPARITQTALTALLQEMDRCRQQLEHMGALARLAGRQSQPPTPPKAHKT